MRRKIIGATVGMGLPKPDLRQTDPKKGDYVKGKEESVVVCDATLTEDAARVTLDFPTEYAKIDSIRRLSIIFNLVPTKDETITENGTIVLAIGGKGMADGWVFGQAGPVRSTNTVPKAGGRTISGIVSFNAYEPSGAERSAINTKRCRLYVQIEQQEQYKNTRTSDLYANLNHSNAPYLCATADTVFGAGSRFMVVAEFSNGYQEVTA